MIKMGGENGTKKRVSDDVRDWIRATSSIGGVRIASPGCGEVLGTHEPTRFNHNGPLYDILAKKYVYRSCKTGLKCDIQKSGLSK